MPTVLGQLLAAAVEDRAALPVLADSLEDLGLGNLALLLRQDPLPATSSGEFRDLTYCLPTGDVTLTFTRAWWSTPQLRPCAVVGLFLDSGPLSLSHPVESTEPQLDQLSREIDRFRVSR